MNYDSRLSNVRALYQEYQELSENVPDKEKIIESALNGIKRNLEELEKGGETDLKMRNIQLLKCEKNIQKVIALYANAVNDTKKETKAKNQFASLQTKRRRQKANIGLAVKEKPSNLLDFFGKLGQGTDQRADAYRAAIVDVENPDPTKRARNEAIMVLERGLDVGDWQDPQLQEARQKLQENFDGDPAAFFILADPYSPNRLMLPAKADMLRQITSNGQFRPMDRAFLANFEPKKAVEHFIAWGMENPNEAQYLLEDVAPLALATGLDGSFRELVEHVSENATPVQFVPKQLSGDLIPLYQTAEAFRLINEGVRYEDTRCVEWFEEWEIDGPLDEDSVGDFVDKWKKFDRNLQPIREKQVEEARKGSLASAKEVYDKVVEKGKILHRENKYEPQNLGFDVHKWPWKSWFTSIFTSNTIPEAAARIALAAAGVAGTVAVVGVSVALIGTGSLTFGITPLLGWMFLPLGLAGVAAIYGYANEGLNAFFWGPSELDPKNISEKEVAVVRYRLNKMLFSEWKKSGFIHTFPKAKKGTYDKEVAKEYCNQMEEEFRNKIEERLPQNRDLYVTPYEAAEAYREVVEKFAYDHKIRNQRDSEQKNFEMAVNMLCDQVLKKEIKKSIKEMKVPHSFHGKPVVPDIKTETS